MRPDAHPLTATRRAARAMRVLGAYLFGWLIAYAGSALIVLLTVVAWPAEALGREQTWVLVVIGWIAVVALGAWLLYLAARSQVSALGLAAAIGGLSALFVPLLHYDFPLHVFSELWFEALMVGVCLPLIAVALSRYHRAHSRGAGKV